MENALKSIIIDAVDEVYIGKLRNKYTGYLGITARDLLDHLIDNLYSRDRKSVVYRGYVT